MQDPDVCTVAVSPRTLSLLPLQLPVGWMDGWMDGWVAEFVALLCCFTCQHLKSLREVAKMTHPFLKGEIKNPYPNYSFYCFQTLHRKQCVT